MKTCIKWLAAAFTIFSLFSCTPQNQSASLEETEIFSLEYGNFEDELNVYDYTRIGDINLDLAMYDGFFYISNAESKKVMELNSYGDLLTLYYNEEVTPRPSFAIDDETVENATRKAIEYPFNKLSKIAVDGRKYLYAVDTLPEERQEMNETETQVLSQIVLRFDGEGNFVDYLGQQGPGGTPFPYVRNIYVTRDNELVVVCHNGGGFIVYWFSMSGYLLFTVPINTDVVPSPYAEDQEVYVEIENVIPDSDSRVLYVNVNYYVERIDESSHMQSGIEYDSSQIQVLNVETGSYAKPLSILPYEEENVSDFSSTTYKIPYDFLGVTESGWLFFILSTEKGFVIQMVQSNGQKILTGHLDVDHSKMLYYTFALDKSGVLSVLKVQPEKAVISWWRTDYLLQSVISNNNK
ncbi:MAG: hypothetical protein J6Y69_07590 [Treponema sp.]|nr:hypothetical protein [Treponema sp.]